MDSVKTVKYIVLRGGCQNIIISAKIIKIILPKSLNPHFYCKTGFVNVSKVRKRA